MFQVAAGSLSGPCVSLLRVDELLLPPITWHIVLLAYVFIPITWLLDLFVIRTEIQWLRDHIVMGAISLHSPWALPG